MAGPSTYPDDQLTTYVRSLPYSDKRPSQPSRVQIPPPHLEYHHGKPSFRVSSTLFELLSDDYGDPTFLRSLTSCCRLKVPHAMLSWEYEMRRTAQPILPFLYLGPSSAARDSQFIKSTGITLLVAVRHTSSVKTGFRLLDPALFASSAGISTLTFDFESPFDFIPSLRPVIKAINDHLAATCSKTPLENVLDITGKVLIFCESGNDRSMVVVAAYLMVIFGIDAVSAIHIIQSQRFSITTSAEMNNALFDLQGIMKAERQVAASNASSKQVDAAFDQQPALSSGSLQRPVKRNIDSVYNSDDDRGLENERSENLDVREGVAPFADVND